MTSLDSIYDSQFKQMNEISSYWHSKSCHLKDSSKVLWDVWDSGHSFDSGDTYRMLMGMSFELLFKSFIVGRKLGVKQTHNLEELAGLAGFTLSKKEIDIFTNLTGYIYWQGKYPVPKPIARRKVQISGGEGIKLQREPFISTYTSDQNIIEDEPNNPGALNSDDLDYAKLLLLWQKFNKHYIDEFIAT
ncbi:hypothetical protein AB4365_12540 [Vibrio breoganii]